MPDIDMFGLNYRENKTTGKHQLVGEVAEADTKGTDPGDASYINPRECSICFETGIIAVLRNLIMNNLAPKLDDEDREYAESIVEEYIGLVAGDSCRHPRAVYIHAALESAEPVQLGVHVGRIPEADLVKETLKRINTGELSSYGVALLGKAIIEASSVEEKVVEPKG